MWQQQKAKDEYSQCVPVLLKPSDGRSMDERSLAVRGVVWLPLLFPVRYTYFDTCHVMPEGQTISCLSPLSLQPVSRLPMHSAARYWNAAYQVHQVPGLLIC